jgi:DNA-binding transcriptional ArsR family regulator
MHLEEAAGMLKTMGHPIRLRIVEVLEDGEQTVNSIVKAVNASQSATSQHLSVMKMKGILGSRRDATCVYYFVIRPEVFKIIRCIRERR